VYHATLLTVKKNETALEVGSAPFHERDAAERRHFQITALDE
jgi:hypothetical protein